MYNSQFTIYKYFKKHCTFYIVHSTLKAGFTLIELMIYMGLLAIFIVVLTTIFTSSLDVQLESRSRSSLEEDSQFIIARLSYDINRASGVVTPATLGTTSPPTPTTPTLALTINSSTYTYSVTNGILYLNDGTGNLALNSQNTTVSAITFQRLGNTGGKNSIRITITLRSKITRSQGNETVTLTTTVGTR